MMRTTIRVKMIRFQFCLSSVCLFPNFILQVKIDPNNKCIYYLYTDEKPKTEKFKKTISQWMRFQFIFSVCCGSLCSIIFVMNSLNSLFFIAFSNYSLDLDFGCNNNSISYLKFHCVEYLSLYIWFDVIWHYFLAWQS